MSLILDALRKSEGERQRGLVPTIYSSHQPVGKGHHRRVWMVSMVIGCAVVSTGMHAWLSGSGGLLDIGWLSAREAGVERTALAAAVPAEVAGRAAARADPPDEGAPSEAEPVRRAALELPPVEPQKRFEPQKTVEPPETAAPQRAVEPQETVEPQKTMGPGAPTESKQLAHAAIAGRPEGHPEPDARQRSRDANKASRARSSPTVRSAAPQAAVAGGQRTAPPVRSDPLPMLWELPESTAQSMPDLQVTMHVYSEHASDRFVRLNGDNYREQDRIDRNLVLEEITEEGAVMNYKGTRFRVER